ncbi:MAG: multiheme c-type cytochrome [Leptospiraceae bacterium]|nr:multiheme c-type cytochrome [Leptospiraceae bacterium]
MFKSSLLKFKRNQILVHLIFCSIILFLFNCNRITHDFTNGLTPILNDSTENSESCKSCHNEIYFEWYNSRHKNSYNNHLFQKSYKAEPLDWCLNCHAPLVNKTNQRVNVNEGVSCIVCHERNNHTLTGKNNSTKNYHNVISIPQMNQSEFCANCHQFNFPTKESLTKNSIHYSQLPMQNTFEEWKSSYYKNVKCQDCHMKFNPIDSYRTHNFEGGHNLKLLNESLDIEIHEVQEDIFVLTFKSIGIGHAFPTGDLFRKLCVEIFDKESNLVFTYKLGYEYQNNPNAGTMISSNKVLISKKVIPQPIFTKTSEYSVIIQNNKLFRKSNYYQLSIEYQDELNSFFESDPKINRPVFKKNKISISKSKGKR